MTVYPNGWITPPKISSPYGPRKGGLYSFHYGTDYIGFDTVCSIAAGTVIYAGWLNDAAGNTIRIKHDNGIVSRYMHNAKHYVKAGDRVFERQSIASMGDTGNATGKCCHLEIYSNGKHVNPDEYLAQNVKSISNSEDEEMIVNIQGRAGIRNGGAYYIANGVATFLGASVANVPTLDFEAGTALAKRVKGI